VRDSNAIHHLILDAYQRRDANATVELIRRHLNFTVEAIEMSEDSPFPSVD
jgi:hypothetical protein